MVLSTKVTNKPYHCQIKTPVIPTIMVLLKRLLGDENQPLESYSF